jgi:MFS family permease
MGGSIIFAKFYHKEKLVKEIIRKTLPLSLIVALRFFGLFIVLSVLSQYALGLPGGTAFLAGVAVGGYALTQAVLQVPFGVLSDRIGRKKTLLIGLLIFAAGSVVAAGLFSPAAGRGSVLVPDESTGVRLP